MALYLLYTIFRLVYFWGKMLLTIIRCYKSGVSLIDRDSITLEKVLLTSQSYLASFDCEDWLILIVILLVVILCVANCIVLYTTPFEYRGPHPGDVWEDDWVSDSEPDVVNSRFVEDSVFDDYNESYIDDEVDPVEICKNGSDSVLSLVWAWVCSFF